MRVLMLLKRWIRECVLILVSWERLCCWNRQQNELLKHSPWSQPELYATRLVLSQIAPPTGQANCLV